MIETNKERLERIKAENKHLRKNLGDLVDKFPQILDVEWVVERAERVQELEEVLVFYADKENYEEDSNHDKEIPPYIYFDKGKKARQVLEALK